jgi:hypothetical protein
MRMGTARDPQTRLLALVQRVGPVLTAVGSVFLVILGVLVINYPDLLAWVVGIALILLGVGFLASLLLAVARPDG